MKKLYDLIISKALSSNGFSEWLNNIPEAIDEWKKQHQLLIA
ncbi:MAG: hypothetical protein WCG95_03955 [bacterium]